MKENKVVGFFHTLIHYWWTYSKKKNVKDNSSGRRKFTPDSKDLHERINNTGNGKYKLFKW